MGTGVVSHDTELMRSWSNTMGDKTNEYDSLVNRLYSLIDKFVGSETRFPETNKENNSY